MKPWAVGILVGATALASVVMWLAERVTKRGVERLKLDDLDSLVAVEFLQE